MLYSRRSRLASLLACLLILCLLTGCSSSSKYAYDTASAPAASRSDSVSADYSGFQEAKSEELPEPAEDAGGQTDEPHLADLTDKLIYSADLVVETTQFDQAVASVEAMTAQAGGFVEQANTWGDTQYQPDGTTKVVNRCANYTLRIPADGFEAFLQQTGSIGNLTSSNRYVENITPQFTDQQARLTSLQTQESRLLDMLAKSTDVESLIQLESRLSEVRYEIESIEQTLRTWQRQVDYSTVNLTIDEVAVYTPTAPVTRSFGEKLSSAFQDGCRGFVFGLQSFVLSCVRNFPALLVLAVLAAAAVLLIRKFVRRRTPKAPQTPEKPEDQTPDAK